MARKPVDLDGVNLDWLRMEFNEHLFIDHLVLYIAAKEMNASSMAEHALDDLRAMFGIDTAFRNRNVFNITYRHSQILKEFAESRDERAKESYDAGINEILADGKPVHVYAVLLDHQENFLRRLGLSKEAVGAGERNLYGSLKERNNDLP